MPGRQPRRAASYLPARWPASCSVSEAIGWMFIFTPILASCDCTSTARSLTWLPGLPTFVVAVNSRPFGKPASASSFFAAAWSYLKYVDAADSGTAGANWPVEGTP